MRLSAQRAKLSREVIGQTEDDALIDIAKGTCERSREMGARMPSPRACKLNRLLVYGYTDHLITEMQKLFVRQSNIFFMGEAEAATKERSR